MYDVKGKHKVSLILKRVGTNIETTPVLLNDFCSQAISNHPFLPCNNSWGVKIVCYTGAAPTGHEFTSIA